MKPSTVYSYDSVLRTHIIPELGALELKEITPQHLSDLRDKLSENFSSITRTSRRPRTSMFTEGEVKAGKATELLASQFVSAFSEEPIVEEQDLVAEMVQ